MLKMSFYTGTLDTKKAVDFVNATNKPCVYTYGFESKHPTTHRKPIDKDKAIHLIEHDSFIDITEEEKVVHINEFSCNDMW